MLFSFLMAIRRQGAHIGPCPPTMEARFAAAPKNDITSFWPSEPQNANCCPNRVNMKPRGSPENNNPKTHPHPPTHKNHGGRQVALIPRHQRLVAIRQRQHQPRQSQAEVLEPRQVHFSGGYLDTQYVASFKLLLMLGAGTKKGDINWCLALVAWGFEPLVIVEGKCETTP